MEIIITPNHFLYKDTKIYHLKLRGLGNEASGYLYCRNNETVSRASSMNKIQLEGICKIKQAIALRQETITDIVPILEAHHWRVIPISGDEVQSTKSGDEVQPKKSQDKVQPTKFPFTFNQVKRGDKKEQIN